MEIDNYGSQMPDLILIKIFTHLRGRDLKNVRQVCKYWRRIAGPFLKTNSCIIYNGFRNIEPEELEPSTSRTHRKRNQSKEMLTYLFKSETKFWLWDWMRLFGMTTSQVISLLPSWGLPSSTRRVKLNGYLETVTTLELQLCSINCIQFMEFLTLFKNLHTFGAQDSEFSEDLTRNENEKIDNLELALEQRSLSKGHQLKCVTVQQEKINRSLRVLVKILEITCTNLENFTIGLESSTPSNKILEVDFCKRLGTFLLKHSSTLQKLTLKCFSFDLEMHSFEHLLETLLILVSNEDNYILEELYIEFNIICLEGVLVGLDRKLLKILTGLKNLKKLSIQNIYCGGWKSWDNIQLLKLPGSNFQIEFGACIIDHPHHPFLEDIEESLEVLRSGFFVANMISLFVSVLKSSPCLAARLPVYPIVIYKNMTDLAFHVMGIRRGERSRFCTFNIDLLVKIFPNLTQLEIVDSKYTSNTRSNSYAARMVGDFSLATIEDSDLQSIILELVQLESLYLDCRLEVTDFGLTGLSSDACCRMISEQKYDNLDPFADIIGVKLSNLKHLKNFALKGLTKITDVSMYHAFEGCVKLERIILNGKPGMITGEGTKYLQKFVEHNYISFKSDMY